MSDKIVGQRFEHSGMLFCLLEDDLIGELIDKTVAAIVLDDSHVIYPENFTIYETCLHPIKKEDKND